MWVVLVAFVQFPQGVGVAGCDCHVCSTRQGSCCCGGGNYDVEVQGGVGGVERDVGSVQTVVVVIWVLGMIHICYKDLLGERALSSDAEDEVH